MSDHLSNINNQQTGIQEPHLPETSLAPAAQPRDLVIVDRSNGELGFSLNEMLIAMAIIGILSVVVIGEVKNAIEKARLSACLANMVTIRETVWANCDGGLDFPDSNQLWNGVFGGHGPRGFWYAIDNDDPNKGHGNDLDGFDEQNPGNAPRKDENIYFVLACEHDHKSLADYVFLQDDGSPQIAMQGDPRPIWWKFYRKDSSGGGGGGNNGGGNNGGGNNGGGNNGGGNNGGGNNGGGRK